MHDRLRIVRFRALFLYLSLVTVLIGFTFLLTGCPDKDDGPETFQFTMEYNCINTVPYANPVDFVFWNKQVAQSLDFGEQSMFETYTYKDIVNSVECSALVPDNAGNPFKVTRNLYTYNDKHHLIFLVGRPADTSMKLLYTSDIIGNPGPGKSLLRILNLTQEKPDVDVWVINTSLHDTLKLSSLQYPLLTLPEPSDPMFNFFEITTGEYDIVYLEHSTGDELFRSHYLTPSQQALTLALIGDPAAGWPFELQDMSVWH